MQRLNVGNAIVVVGAGPVGLVSALSLAREGHHVDVFDGREDPRKVRAPGGRSISLTLTKRGWTALARAGVEPRVRKIAIPLRGRQIHLESGEVRYQPYGAHGEHIDCVARPHLTAELVEEAQQLPNLTLHFGWRCIGADPEQQTLTFNAPGGDQIRIESSRILAADGATSAVRSHLLSRDGFELQRTYSKHFYKELTIPSLASDSPHLAPNALHVWPRGECMLVAFPTPTEGFSFTLFLPMDGQVSFNALSGQRNLQEFVATNFADLVPYLPHFTKDFFDGTPSSMTSLRCYPWVSNGLALIGDAAHAMFPFLGQGLNAGLEDISVLLNCLDVEGRSWPESLLAYQESRKANCDAVTAIAADHYRELAQAAAEPAFLLRKRLEVRLGELFPDELASPYHIVSFSDRPYLEAFRTAELQGKVIERLLSEAGDPADPVRLDHNLVSAAESVLPAISRARSKSAVQPARDPAPPPSKRH
jgi:kynurenine 3-monooxygenase